MPTSVAGRAYTSYDVYGELEAYDRNANIGQDCETQLKLFMNVPDATAYKDLHADRKLSPLSFDLAYKWLGPFQVEFASYAVDLYKEKFLSYNSDDLLEEMYPTGGALTPLVQAREQSPAMGRYSPNKGARVTPLDGLQNNGRPGRPKSRVRPLGRPQSRVDVSVQFEDKKDKMTEKKSYPPPEPEQYNYAIPDMMARPTSPVQRLLERGQSQPFMSVQGGHVPGTQMDPITRQYYHRQWSKQRPTSSTDLSLNRYGRAGGQWRHIRACVANTGSQLAFIDGTVKEEDNVYFPQVGKRSLALSSTMPTYPAQLYAQHPGMMPKYNTMASRPSYRSKFSDHAKSGFKYWYQEPKPIDLRGTTTRMRARIVGNGY